ncbi:diaminobutyrate acetyltransferase [Methanobacterium alkalithermotolerans]|uniref:L-2,4-diaminobutyric acid acetyltransferase n=1 Tax=Methanobacterium alkalithermotolerans TaxID=2731220 RepID=A0A8T8K5T2_9EURY|nr:diaminobutyrate acetyltransferase [Methanobacterium alkalithermotolerans]QUH23958.1 diaminobutyrate acetyltransferase [Methanobacterium alkalithermotolerans]
MGPDNEKIRPIIIRKPELRDGNSIYQLVSHSPPLDINSLYSYLLVCTHFNKSSVVAEYQGKIVGYVSAYIHPHKEDTLFIWQVAVDSSMRGKGLGHKLLMKLIERKGLENIRFLETTVSPSNHASRALFEKLARKMQANLKEVEFLSSDLFGESGHEEEPLLIIGPLKKSGD